MRHFEFREGTSSKFWEVGREGTSVTVRFGRIGTDGQTQVKDHPSEEAAEKVLAKLVVEKAGKGYVEQKPAAAKKAPQVTPGKKPAAPPPPAKATKREAPAPAPGFVDAGGGYELSVTTGKLSARKNGQPLASVPKPLKEGEIGERLLAAVEFLEAHQQECVDSVESWMLRSLAAPRAVLEAVFPDDAWRAALENAIVVPVGKDGRADTSAGGFFRGVGKRGVGVVDREGETAWLDAQRIMIPHPVALSNREDLRALAGELDLKQGISQLYREIFVRPTSLTGAVVTTFSGGKFEELNHALQHAKKLGYRVTGGSAITRIWENGRVFEARYFIGADDPGEEAETGDLSWVDDKQRAVLPSDVPAVALSEGMRMAAAIYGKRSVKKEDDDV